VALSEVAVEPGDTLDFVVDCVASPENDSFLWAPEVRLKTEAWKAADDFRGPDPLALDSWEKYAQVLLETNEFAFVD
jgi:hypothetical protein